MRGLRRRSLIRDRDTAREVAVAGYQFLYPLVLMDVARRQATSVAGVDTVTGRAPLNTFAHLREFAPVAFRDMVRPNRDTLYSFAWLDLSDEPVVMAVPDAADRYYTLAMYDMWSDVFAAPGTRTSGNWPARYGIVYGGRSDHLPGDVRLIESPTPYVRIVGRTQCVGEGDYLYATRFQDGLQLSAATGEPLEPKAPPAGPLRPPVDDALPPTEQVESLGAIEFFSYGAELMKLHPPHLTDHSILHRLERIGLLPGRSFDVGLLPPPVADALPFAVSEARLDLHTRVRHLGWERNGWLMNTETMGAWGNDYPKRATVDRIALSAALPEDILYPTAYVDAKGRSLDGAFRYVLRFARDELPRTRAFWSLTAYDSNGYLVENEPGRYVVSDRDSLRYGPDGSLRIAIQADPPGEEPLANWLPCPRAEFNLCLRLYWPEPEALDRTWAPPPVRRV